MSPFFDDDSAERPGKRAPTAWVFTFVDTTGSRMFCACAAGAFQIGGAAPQGLASRSRMAFGLRRGCAGWRARNQRRPTVNGSGYEVEGPIGPDSPGEARISSRAHFSFAVQPTQVRLGYGCSDRELTTKPQSPDIPQFEMHPAQPRNLADRTAYGMITQWNRTSPRQLRCAPGRLCVRR